MQFSVFSGEEGKLILAAPCLADILFAQPVGLEETRGPSGNALFIFKKMCPWLFLTLRITEIINKKNPIFSNNFTDLQSSF